MPASMSLNVDRPAYPQARAPLSLWATPVPAPPPSASVVAAVVAFGDVVEEREDGETLIRFSPARLEREDMQLLLGSDLDRALDVSVIWDAEEEQIVRVLDTARLQPVTAAPGGANCYARAKMRGATCLVAA